MKKKFLSVILILSMLLSFMPVVSNAAASDVTKLTNYITKYGNVNSNGSISLQDKSYDNGYTIATTMTYRSSDNIIIFHFNMSKQGLSCTISFDYDIASQKAKSNKISANYLNDSTFSSVLRQATFDIGSYTQNSTLNFTTGTINMNPPSNINETFNDITQAAVASWNKLCYQKAGISIDKIGFDSYYSGNVPTPTSDVTKLTSYIERYGKLTNDKTGRKITDSFTEGEVEFIREITYYPNKNTINFYSIWYQDRMVAGIDFTYNITTDTHSNPIGTVQIYSSSTASTPSQEYGCVSYDFNMKTYSKNTTLTFKSLDSGVSQTTINTLNSQMNSLMYIGAIGWDLICLDAGTTLNKIGFDSFYAGDTPTPTPTSTPTPIPTYTVTYDANGGMDAPSEQTAKSGENITIPSQTPTRKYYDFLGWSTSKTAQTAAYTSGSFMKVTANTTLYAVWQKTPMPDTTGNIITISNAQMKGNTVSFTANLSTAHTMQGEMLIAIYDADGALVDIKSYSAEASKDIAFDKKDNYDTVKVFWWYDTYTMYPMANRAEINLDEVKKIYTITKEFDAACGTVQVTKNNQEVTTAAEGEEIAIEVLPNDGYGVLSTEITDADGNVIELTDNAFTMPKGDIKIKVTFIAIIDSGNFGTNNNLTWMLDNNGTFTLSGSGEMQDFTTDNTPWNKYNANIKIVVIEDGITRISKNAFADCSILKRVLINKSVTEIEMSAFKNCVNLRTVEYSGSKSEWEEIYIGSENEQLSNANIIYNSSLSDTLQTDLDYLRYTKNENNAITITACTADAVKINIPKEIEGLPVTNIGDNAFSGCSNLTSITIPDSVTDISEYAFSSCALTDITIPDSVINIGIGAFSGCDSIKTATIGNNVTGIGKFAFGGCSGIKSITVPDSVKNIGAQAFYDCSGLTNLTVGNNVTTIGEGVFDGCDNLKEVYTTDLAAWCKISFGNETANPIYYAKKLYVNNKPLTELAIPDSVTAIGSYAFCNCEDLTKVTIPSTVTEIGEGAFYNCGNLDSVYISDMTAYLNMKFGNGYSNPMHYATRMYFNNKRVTSLEIPEGIAQIPVYAFNGCDSITSAAITNSVIAVGEGAFEGTNLSDIYYVGTHEEWDAIKVDRKNTPFANANVHFIYSITKEYDTTRGYVKITANDSEATTSVEGSSIKIEARPNSGYVVRDITVTDKNGNNITVTDNTFTMPDSHAKIKVVFDKEYTIAKEYDSVKGTVTITSQGKEADKAFKGDSMTINVTPQSGYVIRSVIVTDNNGQNIAVTDNVFTMPDGNINVKVVFDKEYSISKEYDNTKGTVTITSQNKEAGKAFKGDSMTINATPQNGYAVRSVTVTDSHNNNIAVTNNTFTMPEGNVNVNVVFDKEYTITKEYDDSKGTVTITSQNTETEKAFNGNSVTINATPQNGYVVRSVTVTDSRNNNIAVTNNTFTMPEGNVEVNVVFDKEYTITKKYDSAKGTLTITSQNKEADTAFKGDSIAINTVPQSGYIIRSLTVTDKNGNTIAVTDNTFTMPENNVEVNAVFDKEYSITKEYDNSKGTLTIMSQNKEADKAFKGDSMAINVVPQSGYVIRSLNVTDNSGNNIALTDNTFIMPESNINVNVVFDKEYTITKEYDSSKGTVTITSQDIETDTTFNGNSVTINATPQNGYAVRSVTVTDSHNNNIAVTNNTFTMPEGNVEVNVVFDKEYTITKEYDTTCGMVTTTNNGSEVTVAISGQSIKIETALTDIYSIRSITVTDENGNNISVVENTFTMPESNVTINVVFDRAYQISTYCRGGGAIITTTSSGNETDRALSGDEITINITPNNNCVVLAVIVTNNDGHKFTVTDNKFTMPSSNVIVEALVGEVIASGTCGDNLNWKLTNYFATLIISGEGDMENYLSSSDTPWYEKRKNISNIVIENGVTSISSDAFYDCIGLTSITIPDTVTSIGDGAFWRCSRLTDITIPDGVTSIGENMFGGCSSLTSVTIPESVTSIEGSAFSGCSSLTSITIPNGVTSISRNAFSGCSGLTSVAIPDGVTNIGSETFKGCSSLTSITIPDSVTSIGEAAFSNTTYYDNKDNWENDALYIGNFLIKCNSDALEFDVKEGTKVISDGAFRDCSKLTSVTIPDGVTTIPDFAFSGCSSLTSITISDGITSIGRYAFDGCNGLTSITLPDSVTSIGYGLFCECSGLTSVTIPDNVTSISEVAFKNCSGLTSITIPDSVTSIGSSAFSGCSNLTSITIPDSVTSIGSSAFSGCSNLTSVTIPDGVTSIGYGAFSGCSNLTSVTIPDSVTSIGSYAFSGCSSLTSVTIPDSVTSIGGYAFKNCSGLISITLPDSVTSIGERAFYYCSSLTSIAIPEGVTSISRSTFYDCSSLTSITIPDSVTSIGDSAFWGCSGLTSITIPDSVTSIGYGAFDNCSGLTNVTIGNSVTSIGRHAFDGCSGLTSITIPDSVTSIGDSAFWGCSGLTSITIPDSVTSIGDYAFCVCNNLESVYITDIAAYLNINFSNLSSNPMCSANKLYLNNELVTDLVIPDGVTTIPDFAFSGCSSLTSITISDGITSIGDRAFEDCSGLTSITIPDSVTSIADRAFDGCSGLTSITIPDSVTSIGSSAFSGCSGLTTIYYTGSKEEWSSITIGDNGNDYLKKANIVYNYVAE